MNCLEVFKNEQFGEIRITEIDDKIYFCGSDVAKALGYVIPHKAVREHCKDDGVLNQTVIDSMGRQQEAKFISEGNVYRLIAHSKLPEAEKFESWVFDEVLPTIRRKGRYDARNVGSSIDVELVSSIVRETLKAVIPVIEQSLKGQNQKRIVTDKAFKRDRRFKILNLPDELKVTVDIMLDSGITYVKIADYLGRKGYDLSHSAIWRYDHEVHNYE